LRDELPDYRSFVNLKKEISEKAQKSLIRERKAFFGVLQKVDSF
jgi:hypothetical protein